ncbi:hypothetical protein [Nitrosococcus wardiae]|uniref:Uncharacterized protein n=1 Tax=Nitrosococcus wardiae TaxID=1814290 RepID=A0A4P7BYV6_9GAMM|nr:hypothetical protein [Nitrosococcus wardiae]QBQ54360.1 hypothetical protein E3U44_07435 [Nitrosococcus wardiae]
MSKLIITDRAENKTLDRAAMTSVRGGMRAYRSLSWGSIGDQFLTVNPLQSIEQFQGIEFDARPPWRAP